VKFHPLIQQSQGSLRKRTLDEAGLDFDQHILTLVPRMKVRRFMIAVVHVDNDSIETTYDGQVMRSLWALGIHRRIKGSVGSGGGLFHIRLGRI